MKQKEKRKKRKIEKSKPIKMYKTTLVFSFRNQHKDWIGKW